MEKKKLLEIKDLSVTYRTHDGLVYAVNHLNLNLNDQETLGFVGETGAGKTTTALTILRLLPVPPGKVQNGEIIFNGRNLLKLSDRDMRKVQGKEISMIFQDPYDLPQPRGEWWSIKSPKC